MNKKVVYRRVSHSLSFVSFVSFAKPKRVLSPHWLRIFGPFHACIALYSSLQLSTSVPTRRTRPCPRTDTRLAPDTQTHMAISNFVVTIVGIGAVAMLMKTDVRTSASMLRRNLKHMRSWLEEASAAGAGTGEKKALEETAAKTKARKQSTGSNE